MSVLARASLRYLAQHPGQLFLSVVGIALGVAVAVGIELASGSAQRAFELSSQRMIGAATHRIQGGPEGVPESLYVELALDPNGPVAAPVVARTVLGRDTEGGVRPLELFGVDPFAERALRGGSLERALGGLTSSSSPDERNGALLSASTAASMGLAVGDPLELLIDSRSASVRLVGLLDEGGAADDGGGVDGLLVLDIAAAQELCAAPGRLAHIDLVLTDEGQAAALAATLPAGLELVLASARAESLASMTAAFSTNLRALALLSLFVGIFLVYNTITFSVVQRRELWASLRTLGVTRREVFRLVLGEALALGAVGTALGLALGTLLGQGLVGLVARTINDLYFAVEVSSLDLAPGVYLRGALLGLGGTVLGAFAPAREATSQAPRTAQRRSSVESRARIWVPRLAALGALLAALALGLLSRSESLAASFTALFALLLAAALVTPAATLGASAVAGWVLARTGGGLARMATRGVARNLSRNAVAIAALSIAIAASLGMGLMIQSFRGTVVSWLEISLPADVYVSAPSPVASRAEAALEDDLLARFRAYPGVVGATTYRGFETRDAAGRVVFGGAFALDRRSQSAFLFKDGDPESVWERFDAGEVIVSEPLALRHDIELEDVITLDTSHGPREFRVAGVFFDYTSDRGFVHIARAAYDLHWDDPRISSLALFLEPGADAEAVVEGLRGLLRPGEAPHVRSTATLRALSMEVFDRTFDVTSVLRILAGAVAFAGTLSALLALQLERVREIGVLRALGLLPREVRRLVIGETAFMGLIAGLLALPLGVLLSWVLIEHVNARAFGWSIRLALAPEPFLVALGLALSAAVCAGLFPAWRMARTSPATALRAE